MTDLTKPREEDHFRAMQRPVPVVGQIVHYYDEPPNDENSAHLVGPFAAIITQVFRGEDYVSLAVFRPGCATPETHNLVAHKSVLREIGQHWVFADVY